VKQRPAYFISRITKSTEQPQQEAKK
jgi:hypothetical protein